MKVIALCKDNFRLNFLYNFSNEHKGLICQSDTHTHKRHFIAGTVLLMVIKSMIKVIACATLILGMSRPIMQSLLRPPICQGKVWFLKEKSMGAATELKGS